MNLHTSRKEVRGDINDLDGGSKPKRDDLRLVRTDFRRHYRRVQISALNRLDWGPRPWEGDGWTDRWMGSWMDGCMELHLYDLQDIGPFGPLPKKANQVFWKEQ